MWQWLAVRGPSMAPTLRHGDFILIRRGRAIGTGLVVIARFRSAPERLVVKRALASAGDGWLVSSDNPFAGGDSAVYGPADVEGVVVLRWNRTLIWPRRVRAKPSGHDER